MSKIIEWIKGHREALIIGIIIAILLIITLILIFKPKEKTVDGVKIISTNKQENEEITEDEAREIAVKQFKRLGEKIEKNELEVVEIVRKEEKYYYISSYSNTLEIKILGGEITKINTVVVQ